MSDYLPFEIQIEIMKRLPVKSLMQVRSVSKSWKSLIDGSDFISCYNGEHHLLVSYRHESERKYVSIADDHTFHQNKVSLTNPLSLNMVNYPTVIGSSHGLLCLYGRDHLEKIMAVVWNLSIRRAVAIVVPNVPKEKVIFEEALGFGVCRETNDPKIIKITYINMRHNIERICCIPWQVEVFTLSMGVWRPPYTTDLPRKSIEFKDSQVVIDGILYWLAADNIPGGFTSYNLIISIDMTSEEFREITLPDYLANHFHLSISKLRDCLVVLDNDAYDPVLSVWMMEDGVSKSFTKLYAFEVDKEETAIWAFRKNGEPLLEYKEVEDDTYSIQLAACEPKTKHIDNVEIDGMGSFDFVYPYMETLLLLDQPNLIVYNEMETLEFEDDLSS